MFEVGAIVSRMKLDKSGWDTTVKAVEKDSGKLGGFFNRNSESIKKMGMAMTISGGIILAGFGKLIKEASDAEEVTSKFYAVFKEESPAAEKWVNDFAAAVGRSRVDLMNWTGVLQDTFVPLGFARDKAREFSTTMVELAVDLASFNNSAEPDVIRDLQSAIVGNHETMRKYGVIINETALNQEILNMGVIGGKEAATEAEKAQARLNIIMRGTTDAQGDAMRTADGFANVMRSFKAQLQELAIELGSAVMPIVRDLIKDLKEGVTGIVSWIRENPKLVKTILQLTLKLGGLMTILGPLLLVVNKTVSGFSTMKENITKLGPSLLKMKTNINGISSPLGKLGAVGAAAFVGWKIGRLIGELTGLDGKLQSVFTSVFKLDEKYGGLNAEWNKGHTAAESKRQDMLAEASKKAGREVTFIGEAIQILNGEQKENVKTTGEAVTKTDAMSESFKKYLGSIDIQLLSDKNARMNELKGHLDTLDTLYQDGEISLSDYKEAVRKTKEEMDELNGVTATAKTTWKDYIDSLGIQTIQESETRIKELKGYLDELTAAYFRGEISLQDYTTATKAAKDELWNISNTMDGVAIPAARDFSDVVDQAATTMETRSFEGANAMKKNMESISPVMRTITSSIQGAWDGLFGHLKAGTLTFKTAWETIWGGIKNTFLGILQDMLTSFTTNLISGMAKSAADGLSSLFSGLLGGGGGGGGGGVGGLLSGAAGAAAGFNPAAMAGGIAGGILSGLGSLIAGGQTVGAIDATNRELHNIWINTKELRDIIFIDFRQILLRDMQIAIAAIVEKMNVGLETGYKMRGFLSDIAKNTKTMADKLSKMTKAARGAVLDDGPRMIVAGEVPEVVAPVDKILSMAAGRGQENNVTMNANFNVRTYDTNDMRRNVRSQIMPLLIEGLRTGVKKTDLKTALGV